MKNPICIAAFFLASIFAFPARYSVLPVAQAQTSPQVIFASETAILEAGQRLSAEYGSRPPYSGPVFVKNEPLSPEQAQAVIPYLGACESLWRVIKEVDSNGLYSYGPLQMQSSTAALFNSLDHTTYDPMIPFQAIDLTEIALEHGYLSRWTCARIIGAVAP
ncbi:MAG TPA: hypothetical protein VHZ25_08745 [Acidobacteriaceae bacterium]|jgi:hypothetical protein|nr:hypothetical protein [Acidobacteriaceae bacterium]